MRKIVSFNRACIFLEELTIVTFRYSISSLQGIIKFQYMRARLYVQMVLCGQEPTCYITNKREE